MEGDASPRRLYKDRCVNMLVSASHKISRPQNEMVVTSNHIHGIIMVTDTRAGHALPLHENRSFGDVPTRSLHTTVGSYKSAVTKLINRIQGKADGSIWQRNYYEYGVRNGTELNHIREHVRTNSLKWDLDKENPRSSSYRHVR